ncbi:MAG: DnaB-like helicase C-terminal domain-containing protein, partial [Tannerella sp.]|nr:DnaB-like helicase C-terminal domain-containing protein [Tannerella sp.]
RESGAIEQDADMVCFIHRPEYYKILEDDKGNSLLGLAEIIVAKHRNGATGGIRLRFKSDYAKFTNLDEELSQEFTSSINGHDAADYAYPQMAAQEDFIAEGVPNMPF